MSPTTRLAYKGDGVRTSKTVAGDTTEYALDLVATLPVVISDTDAVYLYGLDIIAQQQAGRDYYMHDGLGSVRQLLDSTGEVESNYAYDPFGVPVLAGDASNTLSRGARSPERRRVVALRQPTTVGMAISRSTLQVSPCLHSASYSATPPIRRSSIG